MDVLVERMLVLLRRDPSLAVDADPFVLKQAGLVTKDLPESWDYGTACQALAEAKRRFREEAPPPAGRN